MLRLNDFVAAQSCVTYHWVTKYNLRDLATLGYPAKYSCTPLRMIDFVTCRKRYYNQSSGVYISALEHCRKMKFRRYLHLKLISKIFYVVSVE